MRRKAGTLIPIEVAILAAGIELRRHGEEEFHGYGVARELRDSAEARRLVAHGTLYRALDRLEEAGLLESRAEDADLAASQNRPRRRLYHVTALGETAVANLPQPQAQPAPLRPQAEPS